jgi:hypothetical protein
MLVKIDQDNLEGVIKNFPVPQPICSAFCASNKHFSDI